MWNARRLGFLWYALGLAPLGVSLVRKLIIWDFASLARPHRPTTTLRMDTKRAQEGNGMVQPSKLAQGTFWASQERPHT